MLTLYRNCHCSACDEVQDHLRALTLAHRVVHVDDPPGEHPTPGEPPIPAGARLPVLRDGDETYAGAEAIAAHLEQVARIKDRWQQHGADACSCDE